MKARVSMTRRDSLTACALALVLTALLFTWSPALHPGFSLPRAVPPTIAYCPATLSAEDRQEHYGECPDTSARCDRDPALIALSAAIMLPQVTSSPTNAVAPPLDAAHRLPLFMDISAPERYERTALLIPPRPMTPLAPPRLSAPAPARTQTPTPPYRVELSGDWRGRSVDISPLFAIVEPEGPWSFSVSLRYNEAGQVQHALLESVTLDQPLRDEVVRRLYQCRITPSGAAGEGRLTVCGPGRATRP